MLDLVESEKEYCKNLTLLTKVSQLTAHILEENFHFY